eukprot:gene8583-17710_t
MSSIVEEDKNILGLQRSLTNNIKVLLKRSNTFLEVNKSSARHLQANRKTSFQREYQTNPGRCSVPTAPRRMLHKDKLTRLSLKNQFVFAVRKTSFYKESNCLEVTDTKTLHDFLKQRQHIWDIKEEDGVSKIVSNEFGYVHNHHREEECKYRNNISNPTIINTTPPLTSTSPPTITTRPASNTSSWLHHIIKSFQIFITDTSVSSRGEFKFIWNIIMVFVILLSTTTIAFYIGFGVEPEGIWYIIDLFVDLFLLTDIIINFHTAYHNENGILIRDKRLIAKRYLRRWLSLDFISAFPFDIIISQLDAKIGSIMRALRFLRIFRFFRLMSILNYIRSPSSMKPFLTYVSSKIHPNVVSGLKLLLFYCLVGHFIACISYSLVTFADTDTYTWADAYYQIRYSSIWVKYQTSLYWSFVSIATVGYGDIVPVNSNERIYLIFVVIVGAALFGYTVGTIGQVFEGMSLHNHLYSEKIQLVKEYIRSRRLHKKLSTALIEHYRYYYTHTSVFECADIMTTLPSEQLVALRMIQYGPIVCRFPFLKDGNPLFITGLANLLRPFQICSNQVLFMEHDVPQQMFFVVQGQVELLTTVSVITDESTMEPRDAVIHIATIRDGDFFGESSLLLQDQRTEVYTAKATKFTEAYFVNKEDLLELLTDWPVAKTSLLGLAKDFHNHIMQARASFIARVSVSNKKTLPISIPVTTSYSNTTSTSNQCEINVLHNDVKSTSISHALDDLVKHEEMVIGEDKNKTTTATTTATATTTTSHDKAEDEIILLLNLDQLESHRVFDIDGMSSTPVKSPVFRQSRALLSAENNSNDDIIMIKPGNNINNCNSINPHRLPSSSTSRSPVAMSSRTNTHIVHDNDSYPSPHHRPHHNPGPRTWSRGTLLSLSSFVSEDEDQNGKSRRTSLECDTTTSVANTTNDIDNSTVTVKDTDTAKVDSEPMVAPLFSLKVCSQSPSQSSSSTTSTSTSTCHYDGMKFKTQFQSPPLNDSYNNNCKSGINSDNNNNNGHITCNHSSTNNNLVNDSIPHPPPTPTPSLEKKVPAVAAAVAAETRIHSHRSISTSGHMGISSKTNIFQDVTVKSKQSETSHNTTAETATTDTSSVIFERHSARSTSWIPQQLGKKLKEMNIIEEKVVNEDDCLLVLNRINDQWMKSHIRLNVKQITPRELWTVFGLIHPEANWKMFWDISIGLFILFSVLVDTYELSFNKPSTGVFLIIALIISASFLIDILLSFQTTYLDSKQLLVTNRKTVSYHYIRRWFFIDLISSFPTDIVAELVMGESSSVAAVRLSKSLRLLRLLKISRLVKVAEFMDRVSESLLVPPAALQLFKLVLAMLFSAHFAGCIWFAVANIESVDTITWLDVYCYPNALSTSDALQCERDRDVSSKYLTSLYWAIVTMTTVGFGDVKPSPPSASETFYSIVVVLFGSILTAYFVSAIVKTITNVHPADKIRRHNNDKLNAFLRDLNVPPRLSNAVTRQFNHIMDVNGALDQEQILRTVPVYLKSELVHALYRS